MIQIAVPNDLDDPNGVRGFGAPSSFTVKPRGHADARVHLSHSVVEWGAPNALPEGLGWESRSRLEAAGAAVGRLAEEVERTGARYVLVGYWGLLNPVLEGALAPHLAPSQQAYISASFGENQRYHVSPDDPHWNPDGHRMVARLLYALIAERGLLPELEPAHWPEADSELAREVARVEVERGFERRGAEDLAAELVFVDLDADGGRQVLGGVDARGRVGPYASLLLRTDGPRLRLVGRGLERGELAGLTVSVRVEGHPVGELRPQPGQAFDREFAVPPEVLERGAVSVTLSADDYAYAPEDGRGCIALELERVSLAP